MTTLQVIVDQLGRGRVIVDGFDISGAVVGASLHIEPGSPARMVVDLAGYGASVDAADADVSVSEATRELLDRLGWTPPAASGVES